MRQAQVPPPVKRYFAHDEHPIIIQEFTPGKGWVRTNFKKRVSRSWVRKLKAQGVTAVALNGKDKNGQEVVADFTVKEILKEDKTPLLGGNLI